MILIDMTVQEKHIALNYLKKVLRNLQIILLISGGNV